MTFKKEILLALFFSILLPINSFALEIPEKPGGYVNDYAGLLSREATVQISANLRAYEKETSNQIVVAIFKSLDGESLEDFSIKLAEKWKVGTKDKDNGVILLVFKDDKKVRIEVGYGLEGALTDAISNEIIINQIVPNFKAGKFDVGISNAVSAIMSVTKGEYKATNIKTKTKTKNDNQSLIAFVIFLFFIIPLLAYIAIIFLCISFFGFPLGLAIAFAVIAVLEVIRRMFFNSFGQTFHNGSGGWNDSGFFGGGGFSSGGGFGGFSGGGGSFGGGGSSGNW